METVDQSTGEILKITQGGLYAAFPIPAYQALGNAGQHKAQTLLTCLMSYLGKRSNKVWPSYTSISARCGIPRSQIKPNLDVLEEFGFIRVIRGQKGQKRKNNEYVILSSGYQVAQFNSVARDFMATNYMCKSCGNQINKGETRNGPRGDIHLGCGGLTFPRKIKQVRNKSLNKVPTN